jgi:hypothetical protein
LPQSGWVEHDPEDLWRTTLATRREAVATAGLTARDIAAIGIANHRETTLVWDRATGKPIHNAIVWQDRRTAAMCRKLKETGNEPLVAARTGPLLVAHSLQQGASVRAEQAQSLLARTKSKSMKPNPDGSLTLLFQSESPGADKETNWVPTPKDEFSLYIRAYWPKAEILDGRWAPPQVQRAS